ncbi:hypothetical protein [Endozoicomonas sp.]|uniref:hypothetical protein n=1 Tax=Endozoicomonas sp. TaxID=1892382 RepID=UPI00383A6C84
MDRPSGINGPHHSQHTPPESRPDTPNSSQTITLTQGLRDGSAQEIPTTQLSERSVTKAESASYPGWLPAPLKEIARVAALFSYDLVRTTFQTLAKGWSSLEQEVSGPAQEIPTTQLSKRSVTKAEPASYLGWQPAPLKEITRAATHFSYDLARTTCQTLTKGWVSLGQGVSEASKFGIGALGLAASLAQAGLAAAGEFADAKDMAIPDSKVDMVGWALAKAGIKTVGVPKSELRQLGMSLAMLHLGKQQDIHITRGKLELTSKSDRSAGLRWARSYRPESTQTPSLQTQGVTAPANDQSGSENPIIRISNIHLEGIQPGIVRPPEPGSKKESLVIKADRLAFEVEYVPSGPAEKSQKQPITLSIEIHEPEFIGESNLLSLVATSINRYCSRLMEPLPDNPFTRTGNISPEPPIWNQEETGVQLKSHTANIELRNIKSLAPDMSDYIPDVTSLSLIDLHAGRHQNLAGDQASKPNIFFDSLEFSDNQSGPFHIRTGQMKLDEDLNGSLDIMVQTPFSKLEEFMEQLPEFAKALAKKKVTGNKAGDNRLGIMIHLDISRGDIDLNTLTALGVSEKKLPLLQKQIEKGVIRALKSKHTRFRDLPSGNKEFKLDSVAISDKVPDLLKNKLHGMTSKKISGYYDLGDTPYIKTGSKSRGKISLTELLQIAPRPGSNPTEPS